MKSYSTGVSEHALELGLYANDCCGEELIFDEGETFWQCPRCNHLCDWELESRLTTEAELARLVA